MGAVPEAPVVNACTTGPPHPVNGRSTTSKDCDSWTSCQPSELIFFRIRALHMLARSSGLAERNWPGTQQRRITINSLSFARRMDFFFFWIGLRLHVCPVSSVYIDATVRFRTWNLDAPRSRVLLDWYFTRTMMFTNVQNCQLKSTAERNSETEVAVRFWTPAGFCCNRNEWQRTADHCAGCKTPEMTSLVLLSEHVTLLFGGGSTVWRWALRRLGIQGQAVRALITNQGESMTWKDFFASGLAAVTRLRDRSAPCSCISS